MTMLTRASIAARLTGDRSQALVPLSWWPAMDDALDDPSVRVVVVQAERQSGKTQAALKRVAADLLLVPNSYSLFVGAGGVQSETVFARKLRRPLARLLRAAGLPASTIVMTKTTAEMPRRTISDWASRRTRYVLTAKSGCLCGAAR